MAGRMRRIGVGAALLGILIGTIGLIASAAPAAAADNEGLVCNNQQDRPKDCDGDKNHGTIESSFDTDGNLVLDLDAADGFVGWRQIYICVGTGDTPTNGADCQGSTPTVLHPDTAGGDEYDVTVEPASAITEHDKDVTFAECATGITAVVDAAALPPGGFNWIVHVNSCATPGTTDEAFGSSTRDTTNEVSYECAAPTGVTADAATLRGSTTDTDVDEVTFQFTSPAGESRSFVGVDGGDGGWSAAVTGLQPDTAYTYDVTFFAGEEEEVGSADDCAFATTRGPDSYACAAPTNVTADSATLRGSTTDESVDAASFSLSPNGSTPLAGAETGDSNHWTVNATGLAPATQYTYTVDFSDDGTVHGTGSGAACTFTTDAAAVLSTTDTPVTPTEVVTQVAGVVFTAPTPEVAAVEPVEVAPAVAAAPLARTGLTTDVLLPIGFVLVLFGAVTSLLGRRQELVIVRRPAGEHYR